MRTGHNEGMDDGSGATTGRVFFDEAPLTASLPSAAEGGIVDPAQRGAGRIVTVTQVFTSTVLVLGVGVLALLLVLVVQAAVGASSLSWSSVVIAALMVTPLAISRFGGMRGARRAAEEQLYRLDRFAAANALDVVWREDAPSRPGALFAVGENRRATGLLTGTLRPVGAEPFAFESGDYSFDTWVGRTRMPHQVSYVRVEVSADLPALCLFSRHGRGSRAWQPPNGHERLDTPLDENFEAWGAPGHDAGVGRMLAAPVRRILVDAARDVDIETIGREVYVVARGSLPRDTVAYWRWLADLAELAAAMSAGAGVGVGDEEAAAGDPPSDPDAAARRATLFARSPVRRTFVIGCLLPLAFGVVAAVLSALWR